MYILFGILVALSLIIIVLTITKKSQNNQEFLNKLDFIEKDLQRLESLMRDEFLRNRDESQKSFKDNRVELSQTLTNFSEILTKSVGSLHSTQKEQFDGFSVRIKELTEGFNERFKSFQDQINNQLKENKEDLNRSLKVFQDLFNQSVKDFNDVQIQKFSELILKQEQ